MKELEPSLTENARTVLERRYLARDGAGAVAETPGELFERVAKHIARTDKRIDPSESEHERSEIYRDMMSSLSFLPNSPTLMNAGTRMGQLSACFVIPVEDSIDGIFGALLTMAKIHQSGGGTGFSFSSLRPKDDIVGSTGGVASGPVSFMKIFDRATDVVKQGGRRRGANMGMLRVDHPDIMEFIDAKNASRELLNFNLSVSVTDEFMDALGKGDSYSLVNPRTGAVARRLDARGVWAAMAEAAWATGDPGVVFIDRVNRHNPTPHAGSMEATNPCGEQPLLPYESCNLGSINLTKVVSGGHVDWDRLKSLVREGVRFLDGVIDSNVYPVNDIREVTLANRKIGLGVMGFAEMLIGLGIPYDSEDALKAADEVMGYISHEATRASARLGELRGSFPNFEISVWKERGYKAMRNATVTTVAPTGTIGIIAGTSSGIEPLYAVAFVREVMEGTELMEENTLFVEKARQGGFYSKELMAEIARRGSLADTDGVPEEVKRLFPTALDISPEWHIRMQAAFQRHTDNAVSKTVNMPNHATPEQVAQVFSMAYRLGCKGVTVFRDGCRPGQVLRQGDMPDSGKKDSMLKLGSEYSGECRSCSV